MQPHQHTDRYVPADVNQGWGIAGIVILLVVACIVTATVIHKRTYKHPTDVTWEPTPPATAAPVTAAPQAPQP